MQHISPVLFCRRVTGTHKLFSSIHRQNVQPLFRNQHFCFKNLTLTTPRQYATQPGGISQWFKKVVGLGGLSKSVGSLVFHILSYLSCLHSGLHTSQGISVCWLQTVRVY